MTRTYKLERDYKPGLAERITDLLPGCLIFKNDEQLCPGIPDMLILFGNRWAMLEVKASAKSPPRPLQPYYVELLNSMSFAAFIYPENESEVLSALQQAFEA